MIDCEKIDWQKGEGLVPAVVQESTTGAVLMLAYMNHEALEQTLNTQWVTFYSRRKKRLWVKGESSGHTLKLCHIALDCDGDTLLIQAQAAGPACHLGHASCFQPAKESDGETLAGLQKTIANRIAQPTDASYTASLVGQGIERVAQKVGEEAVEVVIAAMMNRRQPLCNEAADLLFHLLILLTHQQLTLSDVIVVLRKRQRF